MKRVKPVFWIASACVCLPLFLFARGAQTAHREAEVRKRQHQLNVELSQASQENAVAQMEELLAKGAEANALSHYYEPDSSLSAVWQQWWQHWRGTNVQLNIASSIGESALDFALQTASQNQFKDWRALKLLIDHGANANERGFMGTSQTALDWTTELKDWKVTNYLLEHGATPNITGMMDSNPFLQTVACDNLPIATKMLDKGANVNFVPTEQGDTALCIAVLHENQATIRLLLARGADINLPNSQGQTPLHRCQGSAKEVEIATLLLNKGADLNRQDKDGNSPLMMASKYNDPNMTRLYLSRKADTTLRNKQGQTALQLAQSHKSAEIITVLRQAGALR